MTDHIITIPGEIERDVYQQPQQGWLKSVGKFHVVFGLLKLSTVVHFQSLYIRCEAIYLISLIEVTVFMSPNRVYWYFYIIFGTLGFELLLWMNLSLVFWLLVNLCLLAYALTSTVLLARGSDQFLQLVQPFDDRPFSEVEIDL